MAGPNSDISSADGSLSFEGGVDSLKTTTVASPLNPNGILRSQLPWLNNGTVRDSGITPRGGWKKSCDVANSEKCFQGGYMYQPESGDPYPVFALSGKIYRQDPSTCQLVCLSETAFQPRVLADPYVVLQNLSMNPGDAATFQGVAFVVPAVGSSVQIDNVTYDGEEGDIITFTNSFLVTASTRTWNGTRWQDAITLQNVDCPPGTTVNAQPNEITGYSFGAFVAPAIGGTVDLTVLGGTDGGLPTIPTAVYHFTSGSKNYTFSPTGFITGLEATYNDASREWALSRSGILAPPISYSLAFGSGWYEQTHGSGGDTLSGFPNEGGPWAWDAFITPGTGGNVFPLWRAIVASGAPSEIAIGTTLHFARGSMSVSNIYDASVDNGGMPSGCAKLYYCQAEQFLVIQAGDYKTLPLFWDGTMLRRSIGINDNAVAAGTPGINEIPPAGPMDYYMDRLWYSQGGIFAAGDIVRGNSGTGTYNFRDAVLNVTENPLVVGGDGFSVPSNEGNVTALSHNANQDAALGQGRLFAFTAKGCHALSVPITRADWIAATTNNKPLLVPVQLVNGAIADRSIVPVNGDLYFQSLEPSIRSIITAVRYFNQKGNVSVSAKIERVLKFTDRSLLSFGTGILFDNRLLQSVLPVQTDQGVVHQAVAVLDFTPLNKFGSELDPTWEGMWYGLDILQMLTGVYDGLERAFAFVVNRQDSSIEYWELTKDERFDNTENRIEMQIEFPAFTWAKEFSLKKLIAAELWVDRLFGEVVFTMEYRPDGETCWTKWHEWKVCTPTDTCTTAAPDLCTGLVSTQCYPATNYGECYQQTMVLPEPPVSCRDQCNRPSNIGYQFQPRLTIKGFCRVRGILLHATPEVRKLYQDVVN